MTFKNLLLIFVLTSFPLSNIFTQNLFEQGKQLFQKAKFQEAYQKLKQDGEGRAFSDNLFLASKRLELESLIYLGGFNQAEFELEALINQIGSGKDLEPLNCYIFKSLLARVKLKKGQFKEGVKICESLIPYFKSNADQSHLATVYNLLGQCLNGNGERGKAIDFQKQCLLIREKIYGPNDISLCEPLGGIAYAQIYLEEYAAAKLNYDRAKEIINTYPKDHPVKIYINNGIGVWHRNQGQYQKAIDVLLNAAKYNEELFGPFHYRNGSMYGNIAGLFELSKEDKKSIFYGLKTRAIFLENYGPLHPYLARSNRGLGNSYLNQKDYAKAMYYFQHALKAVVHNIDPSQKRVQVKREDFEISHDLLLVLQDIGLAYFTKYADSKDLLDLKLAEEYYDHTVYCVDLILESYLEDASKKLLLSDAKNFYERAMHVAFENYKRTNDNKYLSKAFVIAEKSKSTLLRKSMQTQEAIRFSSIPDSLKFKEQQIRKKIGSLKLELQIEKRKEKYANKNIVDKLESEIFKLEESFIKTLSTFKDNYQDYYKLKYGNQLLPMEEAIKKLGAKQEAINFFWGEDYIFIIHFSNSAKQFFKIPNSKLFEKNLKLILENIANPKWAEEEANKADVKQDFIKACSYMYQKLIGKLDIQKEKHLVIIPDGPLFYLPFEVLIDQENYAELDYGDYNYLLKKHPLRYDFSLSAALENTETKQNKKGLIAFAPSYKKSNRKVLNKEMNFYPLNNAEHEVHWLDQVLGAEAYFEENAQETTFKSKNNLRIQHLAMHGFLNEEDDLFSGLVFAKPTDQEDGILYAYEIYDMELNCDLVCLSACNTGIGKLQKGEGVMSLGRAFKHAGSASVCMSLWVSEDQQNRTLMQNFYKGLRDKLPKDIALQKAKLSLLKNDSKQFPHFWAAYILMGSNKAISFNQGYANYFWGGIILLTLILGLMYFFRKRLFGESVNSKDL
jgi:CHAT domain-containing protein